MERGRLRSEARTRGAEDWCGRLHCWKMKPLNARQRTHLGLTILSSAVVASTFA
jgi:hypothetical protein